MNKQKRVFQLLNAIPLCKNEKYYFVIAGGNHLDESETKMLKKNAAKLNNLYRSEERRVGTECRIG